jgi:hypothetical protein
MHMYVCVCVPVKLHAMTLSTCIRNIQICRRVDSGCLVAVGYSHLAHMHVNVLE